ncbi:Lrp/AsnC family transcriptional regulator [Bradyrhizobium jicamae]|uniref:Lrp/AsnC family transcriptional regulator n=1 Tax=Bradyrhizobium jicamae TaxID=280332 RepID=A0ABS5FSX0_9BRAD|nr:Lrp/AsnC family transcriptional regulator [Bradyrhizobium jicamae]MBR0799939.1 Lrp/AsnC family transcriptional regulator [Bradyrhizobium jicamae]
MDNPAKPGHLDAIDRKILSELQVDARLPNNILAERVGLSPSPCSRRVKLLEEAGVIAGYRTVLDRAALGLSLTIFAGIRVDRHSAKRKKDFIDTILKMPEVVACHLVSGDVDFLVEIVVTDMAAYEEQVLSQLLAIPELRDIRTSFAMRTYKSGGALPIKQARFE